MANIKKQDHDGFQGNVGPLTVTRWKSTIVVKTRQQRPDKPRTTAQKTAAMRFALLTRLAALVLDYARLGFRAANPQHAVISSNLRSATAGSWPDVELLYDRLTLSQGTLPPPADMALRLLDDGRISLRWSNAAATPHDSLMLLLFAPECAQALTLTDVAHRDALHAEVTIPPLWSATTVLLFACFVAPDATDASATVYLGAHQAPRLQRSHQPWQPPKGWRDAQTAGQHTLKRSKRKANQSLREATKPLSDDDKAHVANASGVIGDLSLYRYKNQKCVKTRPQRMAVPPSPAKQRQNRRFAVINHFLRQVNDFLRVGMRSWSATMTPHNAAIKLNYAHAFLPDVDQPQVQSQANAQSQFQVLDPRLDYSTLLLADGPLQPPQNLSAIPHGDTVLLSWNTPPSKKQTHKETHNLTKVIMALYDETADHAIVSLDADPSNASRILLPVEAAQGHRLHLWLAIATPTASSQSVYIPINL